MRARLFLARGVLVDAGRWISRGAVLVRGGRVAAVGAAEARRAASAATTVIDLGDRVLTAGLVNAHAHLELTGLAGTLPRGGPFGPWVRELLRLRGQRSHADLRSDALAGARRALESGTTCIGDVDTTGAAAAGLRRPPLRVVSFREVLDAQDRARTADAVARLRPRRARGARFREGLAPHAPFTASPALLHALGRRVAGRRVPISIHWAETAAEVEWLERGTGPLADLVGPSPRLGALELLAQAGLLRPPLALVHGNHPASGEPEAIAAAGAVVVHCPGSHAWFDREPFPLARYRRAGARLALGTDSLASNESLSMPRELALLREAHPHLGAAEAWDMATRGGAAALGLEQEVGSLAPGARADLLAWEVADFRQADVLDQLTRGSGRLRGAWIGGLPAGGGAPRAGSADAGHPAPGA